MATKLILIRHGQTEWNHQKRYCGSLDIPLNEKGRAQARKLRARFKKERVEKVYTSDKKRAIETAEIIFGKNRREEIPALGEMHFGIFEGLTYKEIMAKYPVLYKKWLDDPASVTIPRGEKLKDFRKRVLVALRKLLALNKGKTIAVVSHGGSISIIINHILKSNDFWGKIPAPASVTTIEFNNGKANLLSTYEVENGV